MHPLWGTQYAARQIPLPTVVLHGLGLCANIIRILHQLHQCENKRTRRPSRPTATARTARATSYRDLSAGGTLSLRLPSMRTELVSVPCAQVGLQLCSCEANRQSSAWSDFPTIMLHGADARILAEDTLPRGAHVSSTACPTLVVGVLPVFPSAAQLLH